MLLNKKKRAFLTFTLTYAKRGAQVACLQYPGFYFCLWFVILLYRCVFYLGLLLLVQQMALQWRRLWKKLALIWRSRKFEACRRSAKTCFEMYSVTSTGLAPEIVYYNVEVRFLSSPILHTISTKFMPMDSKIWHICTWL